MNAPLPDALRQALASVSLEDKWTVDRGRVYLSGTQALVRLLMLQRQRDQLAGRNTAGFLTGYRGSPLGAVDLTAWKAKPHLERNHIRFQPGVNEDLAATSLWGTQQVNMFAGARYDGVFGMWYGKGPGADRCGDVFKHANAAGTSPRGGVIVACGDDHGAKSSTLPHQSDHLLKACMIPVLFPTSVQEYLDLGVHAYAMSRYAGVWVGFKCVTEIVETASTVFVDPERVEVRLPEDFAMPAGGLNIRWPDTPLQMEARLLDYKLYAALAYCRSNRLNATVIDSPHARFGIVASGKAYLDTRQALIDLGLDETACQQVGIRLFKCAMVWPLEARSIGEFAEGLTEILVIEEKRQIIEYQLKEELFQWLASGKKVPRVIGKFDEKDGGEWAVPQGNWILPAHYELSPAIVAKAIAARIRKLELPAPVRARIDARIAVIEAKERELAVPRVVAERTPHFCSGCPHNTSTRVPEGSRAVAGIGCHYMATWMDRSTSTFAQMGGEGVPWIGQAPFTSERHIFANLGDGTYFHSGSLAIRAAVAAKVAITYKILFNDAVAMTGGQPVDGILTVPQITRQLAAEGVQRIVVVTPDADKYPRGDAFAPGVRIAPRENLDAVQRELREYDGVSALIFDQTCAAELRRRRKRGTIPDPPRHVVINELICEGCGDCSVASNCLSVEPVQTEFGRKRRINQSSCNKDFSCLNGFCPSFVTVEGGRPRRAPVSAARPLQLPWPTPAELREGRTYGIIVAGIGGTGVVTIGQLLGMAAHIEGRGVSVLDMAGLAQKGGAVHSHIQIAAVPEQLFATRIAMGEADLLLGCDLIVSTGAEVLAKFQRGRTRALLSSSESPTAEFVRNREWQFPSTSLTRQVRAALGEDGPCAVLDAQSLATELLGDALFSNPLLLGAAWQQGWIPLRYESLLRAIELNGAAVEANKRAFEWGRAAAHDLAAVRRAAAAAREGAPPAASPATSLEDIVRLRADFLVGYQDQRLAERFRRLVERVALAERGCAAGSTILAEAVARNYFKLLAVKDEYEVARLHRDPQFRARIAAAYEGSYRLNYHLAPPLVARRDPRTGQARKMRFGPWLGGVFAILAGLRFLRGRILDPFAHTPERRVERELLREYEQMVEQLLPRLTLDKLALAVRMASFPEEIRGFGHVKLQSVARVRPNLAQWRTQWAAAPAASGPAAAQG
ncbi:Indolepyruvate ferredoxin oxidoreductase [Burkholderiales bacterium]|nr:Indolepyruvate ferredoxin oxidoreductase [Burkholderiales bacterium]